MKNPELAQLIPLALEMVNTVGLDNASVSLKSGPEGLRVRIEFRDVTLRAGRLDGVAIDEGLVHLEGLDPSADPRAMLAGATIRIERLLIRVSASLVNRLLESEVFQAELRRRVPVETRNLELLFSGERVTFRGQVRKGLAFPFEVQLGLAAVNNRLRISFKEFWAAEMVPLPGFARKLVMSVARSVVEGRRELKGLVRIEDDFAEINPWPRIPLRLDAEFNRFGVEGHFLVIEMGPSAASRAPSPPAQAAPASTPALVPGPAATQSPLLPPIPAPSGPPV